MIGSEYFRLKTRASCFVQITPNGNSEVENTAKIFHFWTFKKVDSSSFHLAGVEIYVNDNQEVHGFNIIHTSHSPLTYISVVHFQTKVNLFPIMTNNTCSAY